MNLTTAQLQALRADVAANTAAIPAGYPWSGGFAGTQVKDVPAGPDGDAAVAGWYNLPPAGDYYVWDSRVPILSILNLVTWANYTPNDAPSETLIWNNRAFGCQIKQTNLQLLFVGRTTFDASKVNLRSALNDATTNLPTGASGASRSGGWSGILPVLSRKASNVEKLLAVDDGAGIGNNQGDARGANTNPDLAAFEGAITGDDVRDARLA